MGDAPRTGNTGEPEALTEKALREASPVVEVFGETLVKNSKTNWKPSKTNPCVIVLCVERVFMCSELLFWNLSLKFDLGSLYMHAYSISTNLWLWWSVTWGADKQDPADCFRVWIQNTQCLLQGEKPSLFLEGLHEPDLLIPFHSLHFKIRAFNKARLLWGTLGDFTLQFICSFEPGSLYKC